LESLSTKEYLFPLSRSKKKEEQINGLVFFDSIREIYGYWEILLPNDSQKACPHVERVINLFSKKLL
jgi:hypothetical protein